MKENLTELLSPAGGPEALRAAVQNGADAVYLGLKRFSARQNAENFSDSELAEAVRYCHIRGAKAYLTLNTLMRPGEEGAVEEAVTAAAESGIDGLIIQDLGVAELARGLYPGLARHASTQLSAHSSADVLSLMEKGFSRVVLSRELSAEEIGKIYDETGCELEAFVHGALCVSFSGRCLMSSFIGGRSGNRGCCAQPCRQRYACGGETGYYLSPRDLCLVKRLDEMRRSGIVSFKIEGRMKSPEYVATVTGVYRRALDGERVTAEDMKRLTDIFSRGDGFTEGYFSGLNTPEIMNTRISNDNISADVPKELLAEAHNSCREGSERRRVAVDMRFSACVGKNMALEVTDADGNSVRAEGGEPSPAQKSPMTAESAARSLAKTGGTPYYVRSFEPEIEDGLFAPASELNALRRACLEELNEVRGSFVPFERHSYEPKFAGASAGKQELYASVESLEQLAAAMEADRVILPLSLLEKTAFKEKYIPSLPQIVLDGETVRRRLMALPKGTEVYASTLGGLRMINEAGLRARGDFGLNISNSASANLLGREAVSLTLSPELSLREIKNVAGLSPVPVEVLAYGRQILMVSRACIIRGIRGKCDCRPLTLRDKTGAEFPVRLRLSFTDESPARVREIIEMYRNGGKAPELFTRGYF